jgi:hypothetical protein
MELLSIVVLTAVETVRFCDFFSGERLTTRFAGRLVVFERLFKGVFCLLETALCISQINLEYGGWWMKVDGLGSRRGVIERVEEFGEFFDGFVCLWIFWEPFVHRSGNN